MKKSMLAILSLAAACSAAPERTTFANDPGTAETTGGAQTGGDGQTGGATNGDTGGMSAPPPVVGNEVGCNKMDILFVIDNSGSMAEEQENLAANFPKFIDVLNNFQNGSLDYRVAVTTTSFPSTFMLPGLSTAAAEQGALLKTDEMTKHWLERTDPNVAQAFTRLATVGVDGSGQEQQLRAARSAVTDRVADGSNKDFMREDALLAIVILTDEDDGSEGPPGMVLGLPVPGPAAPVMEFVTAFDMVKGDRSRWAATVIAGDEDPTCDSQFGSANHAARLLDFVEQTGKNGVFSSICEGDLSLSIEDALKTFSVACDNFVVI